MFIRPIGTRVEPARRPAGRPLLRGLLTRAAGAASPSGSGAVGRATGGPESGAAGAKADPESAGAKTPEARSGAAHPDTEPPRQGLAAELAQLANLAREGLLTPQEFKEAKARLLRP
ncbi:hypothetical protein ACFY0N_02850 [Streptomyces vinaceus]|uniref:SHOCT domain-containing protein n=1 Tax=Streptomyces vinaceus TaxID=1960 RepID=UPI0035D7C5DE